MSIMVVDDSERSRMLLETLLPSMAYVDILSVDSGRGALAALEADYERNGRCTVDLVLMDLLMADMNGIEATATIKGDDRFKDVVIVFVSVTDDKYNIERALEAGAVDYIAKPVDKVEMRARVRSALRLKEEIDRRKAREAEREDLIRELQSALSKVKLLSGLVPICSVCKSVRTDEGYWQQIESYIQEHSNAEFSHSICPDCLNNHYTQSVKDK